MTGQAEAPVRERRGGEWREGRFVNAPRVHTAVTAEVEKRLLTWLARRTPAAINPDHLTALAFLSQLLAGAAYALASRDARALWLVNGFVFLNWLETASMGRWRGCATGSGHAMDFTWTTWRTRLVRWPWWPDSVRRAMFTGRWRPECWRATTSSQ